MLTEDCSSQDCCQSCIVSLADLPHDAQHSHSYIDSFLQAACAQNSIVIWMNSMTSLILHFCQVLKLRKVFCLNAPCSHWSDITDVNIFFNDDLIHYRISIHFNHSLDQTFSLMCFVDLKNDFEVVHYVRDWQINCLMNNSILTDRIAAKHMMNVNKMKQNAVMLLSWPFSSSVWHDSALPVAIGSNSWTELTDHSWQAQKQ